MTTVPFLLVYILSLILIYNLGSEDKENNDCLGFFFPTLITIKYSANARMIQTETLYPTLF